MVPVVIAGFIVSFLGLAVAVITLVIKINRTGAKGAERIATIEADNRAMVATHKALEGDLCVLRENHEKFSRGQGEKQVAATRLEGKIDLLSAKIDATTKAQTDRLESFQGQVLRDLAAVADTVELRIRRDLEPLLSLSDRARDAR